MIEYGHGVGQVSEGAGRGGGPSFEVGASVDGFLTDAAQTISSQPPAVLVAGAIAIVFLGLLLLRRAF